MSIIATDKGVSRQLIPAGNYIARCYQMIQIGTTTEVIMGKTVTAPKVRIGWELPTEKKVFDETKGEQPLVISMDFTLSMHSKSTLRKTLASWRGKDFAEDEAKAFDVTKLLGKPCFLNVIHRPGVADPTKMYEKIASITPLPKGVTCPDQITPLFVLSYDEWSDDKFRSLPEFIQEKIKSSSEFQQRLRPESTHVPNADEITEPLDDLPF